MRETKTKDAIELTRRDLEKRNKMTPEVSQWVKKYQDKHRGNQRAT